MIAAPRPGTRDGAHQRLTPVFTNNILKISASRISFFSTIVPLPFLRKTLVVAGD
jgi:hypothetical protein